MFQLFDEYTIMVNCSGVHSRFLANDDQVTAMRGQVIRMNLPNAYKTFTSINRGPSLRPLYYYWT